MATKTTRNAQGGGTIRQRPDGRWEARYTVGRDPGTGKQVQRSVYGATQKEVRQKLSKIVTTVDDGTYKEPCRMTLGQWLDIWTTDYLPAVKPDTAKVYKCNIKNHIKPVLGSIKLETVSTHTIQHFINGLKLSPASVQLAYKVLHQALQMAVKLKYISHNPSDDCILPKKNQKEITPLDDEQIASFLKAISGSKYEALLMVDLFTGLRQSELLGLTWDCVDFEKGSILVSKQLTRTEFRAEAGMFMTTKSGKSRRITPAPTVMKMLRDQRRSQTEMRLKAGELWDNPHELVFTNGFGGPLRQGSVQDGFKEIARSIGMPNMRFHDLRHSYAVAALRAGNDVKSVQESLGHFSAAFTLDVYGHVTEQMRRESADRMEDYIKDVSSL